MLCSTLKILLWVLLMVLSLLNSQDDLNVVQKQENQTSHICLHCAESLEIRRARSDFQGLRVNRVLTLYFFRITQANKE